MVRLLRLTPYALIVLAAIEGSVVHLAHSEHCHHRHVGGTHDGSHTHQRPELPGLLLSATMPADGICLACAYLAQRAGVNTAADTVESSATVDAIRPLASRVDEAATVGVNRARAPPVVG